MSDENELVILAELRQDFIDDRPPLLLIRFRLQAVMPGLGHEVDCKKIVRSRRGTGTDDSPRSVKRRAGEQVMFDFASLEELRGQWIAGGGPDTRLSRTLR